MSVAAEGGLCGRITATSRVNGGRVGCLSTFPATVRRSSLNACVDGTVRFGGSAR